MQAWQNAMQRYRQSRAFAHAAGAFLDMLGHDNHEHLDQVQLIFASTRLHEVRAAYRPKPSLSLEPRTQPPASRRALGCQRRRWARKCANEGRRRCARAPGGPPQRRAGLTPPPSALRGAQGCKGVDLRGMTIRVRTKDGGVQVYRLKDVTRAFPGVPHMLVVDKFAKVAFQFNLHFVEKALVLKHTLALRSKALIRECDLRTMCIGASVETIILLEFVNEEARASFQEVMLDSMRRICEEMRDEAAAEYLEFESRGQTLGM